MRKAIKHTIVTTNGSIETYYEQRYARKHSQSYHDFVKQEAEINKFISTFGRELQSIKVVMPCNSVKGLQVIEKSSIFTVSKDAKHVLFSDQVSRTRKSKSGKKVQRDPRSVELELLGKVKEGMLLGLLRNSLLGSGSLVSQFRNLSSEQQSRVIAGILDEIHEWQLLIDQATEGSFSKSANTLSRKASTKKTKSPRQSSAKHTISTLKVVISIDFEWDALKLKDREIRRFGDVLSGQYAMFFPDYPDLDIHGVVFNDYRKGFNFRQFFLLLVDRIQKEFIVKKDGVIVELDLKKLNVLLTGYFMGVDFSALTGWNKLRAKLTVIDKQKIFSLRPYVFKVRHKLNDEGIRVSMTFRDTALLAPMGGLKRLGEIVGQPKIDTSVIDKQDFKAGLISQESYQSGLQNGGYYKSHMDVFLKNHFHKYVEYALNDSVVALKYLKTVVSVYGLSWNFTKLPPTTSNYAMRGVSSALEGEEKDQRIFPPNIEFSKLKIDPVEFVRDQYRDLYSLASAAYYGGFNVAFCSVAGKARIVDLDLSSAYNSGGALMPRPNYSQAPELNKLGHLFNVEVVLNEHSSIDFQALYSRLSKAEGFPFVLGVVKVSFEYPKDYTGITTTPQRSPLNDNPVYVKTGENVVMPLIDAINAYEHGAKIMLRTAIIPAQYWDRLNAWSKEQHRFLRRRQKAKRNRDKFPKGSPEYLRYEAMQQLYKLAGNTIYGKSAQSVRPKKSRNYMTNAMDDISISQITDPLIAGMYTAITRYLVHHLYDAVSKVYRDSVIGLNITTDGYTFALIGNAKYNFQAVNDAFNQELPDFYRKRLKSIGYSSGFERKGDQTDQVTRFYNGRTRLNGTVDIQSLNAMGGIYYQIDDDLQEQVKKIYNLYLSGEIYISSASSRMSNLTEMKFGTKNHAQGLMYDWSVPVRIPLQTDCAYKPDRWIGDLIDGFGFDAKPFSTVKEHDRWKSHTKVLTDRWNIMRTPDRFSCYLETMKTFGFNRTGRTLDEPTYHDKAIYLFDRLQGKSIPIQKQYAKALSDIKAARRAGRKLPICEMAIYQNQKARDG